MDWKDEPWDYSKLPPAPPRCYKRSPKTALKQRWWSKSSTILSRSAWLALEASKCWCRLKPESRPSTSCSSRKGLFDSRKNSKSLPPLRKVPGPVMTHKYLWIRIALVERILDKIVDFLVKSADKYYSPESLIADPTDGPIIASLLG